MLCSCVFVAAVLDFRDVGLSVLFAAFQSAAGHLEIRRLTEGDWQLSLVIAFSLLRGSHGATGVPQGMPGSEG